MHFLLLAILDEDQSLEDMLNPFWEGHEIEEDEEGYWYNPDGKWDWFEVGGRWYGRLEATKGEHGERAYGMDRPDREGHYDIARVSDLTSVPEVYSVLTPDGEWYDREEFREDLKDEEHPFGRFVPDEHWKDRFEERFIEPHRDCVAYLVDYHS